MAGSQKSACSSATGSASLSQRCHGADSAHRLVCAERYKTASGWRVQGRIATKRGASLREAANLRTEVRRREGARGGAYATSIRKGRRERGTESQLTASRAYKEPLR